jgi:hypothetical protein
MMIGRKPRRASLISPTRAVFTPFHQLRAEASRRLAGIQQLIEEFARRPDCTAANFT